MPDRYRIVIAEDYTILRHGLKALIASDSKLHVVGEAEDGRQAIQCVKHHLPDLLLIDLSMPHMNGIDALREIKREFPDIRAIVLTVHKSDEYLTAALQAGADGYVLKDASRDELLNAIHHVLAGKSYLSPTVSKKVINGYLDRQPPTDGHTSFSVLTRREREILTAIAEGGKNKDIAHQLCISPKTVEKHRSNLMKKLDLHNAAELTSYAISQGLVVK